MCYLQNILKRHNTELVRRVYTAMKESSTKGDWYEQVKKDFSEINEHLDEEKIATQSENEYKNQIKKKVRDSALKRFNKMKQTHSKIKDLIHESLAKPQNYITSNRLNNKQTSVMVNLRSRCLKSFKKNFPNMHGGDQNCPLCGKELDTQEHALHCHKIKEHMNKGDLANMQNAKYTHMSGSTEEQASLASVYINILRIRERLLEETPQLPAYQGIILDQPTRDTTAV